MKHAAKGYISKQSPQAMDCTYMIAIAIVSVVITCGLLLHHKYKHSDPGTQPPYTWSKGEYIPDSREQWFQRKDIGNWQSHECYVLVFGVWDLQKHVPATVWQDSE